MMNDMPHHGGDGAVSFHDSLALVEKNGKLSYIDHDGVIVWQEK